MKRFKFTYKKIDKYSRECRYKGCIVFESDTKMNAFSKWIDFKKNIADINFFLSLMNVKEIQNDKQSNKVRSFGRWVEL